jgi:hypothetical protein
MKSIRSSRQHHPLILTVVVLLAVFIFTIGTAYILNIWPFEGSRSSEDNTQSDPIPSISEQTTNDPTSNSIKNNPPNQEEERSVDTNIEITTAMTSSDTLTVRTLISKITTEGSCELSLQKQESDDEYNESVGIQALPSASTCQGFSIPLSKLSNGTWTVTVHYIVNGLVKGTATKEVVINA